MKLLVVIALLGFAAAGPREHHVNFCRGNSEAREDAGALRAVIQIFLPNIIGYSEPFKHKDFGWLKITIIYQLFIRSHPDIIS